MDQRLFSIQHSVFNVKVLVGTLNQEDAPTRASNFKLSDGSFPALSDTTAAFTF